MESLYDDPLKIMEHQMKKDLVFYRKMGATMEEVIELVKKMSPDG